MPPVSAIMIGAGSRGRDTYGAWALRNPGRLRLVGVVEPDTARRERFADAHGIASTHRFDVLPDDPPPADAWIIAGPDRSHARAAAAAVAAGAATLLEKPMAATAADCVSVVHGAAEAGLLLQVALVLRSTPFFSAVRDVVSSGELGDLVDVAHRENVAAWHMAHSFVRGNWSRAGASTPMAVQKTCHDFDIISWISGAHFDRLASFGSLHHFRPEHAPAGATGRCTNGCPIGDCPFDARRIYLDPARTGWPVNVITDDVTRNGRLEALGSGPYGRCVYVAGSDVVDHQVTAGELEGGGTFTLTMHGHAPHEERTMRYEGTRATLRGRFGSVQEIEVVDHVRGSARSVRVGAAHGGHGGGDDRLIDGFVRAVAEGHGAEASTGADVLEGHLAAFGAEQSRVSGLPMAMVDVRSAAGL